MPERPKLRLPFGGGLDRTTGNFAAGPGTFRDLRNLIVKEGKATARAGLTNQVSIAIASAPATDIVGLAAWRAAGRAVVAAQDVVRSLTEIFVTAVSGLNPTDVGAWPDPGTIPSTPMRAFLAESYNKLFLADDQEDYASRRKTLYLDYTAPSTFTINALQSDMGSGSPQDLYFRGVVPYLSYLIGWGFGDYGDEDRPEIVRVCLPGDPTTWDKQHYFIAGPRGEPVLLCVPSHLSVMVFKDASIYEITGTDRPSFGIQLLDPLYGIAGARLAFAVAGNVYFWSREGPRVVSGTKTTFQRSDPSEDLGLPLDLGGPDPAALVASGEAADGWSIYVPEQKVGLFAFPNRDLGKTRVYVLSLRDPQQPRWSYFEYERCLWSAAAIYSVAGGAPTGHPAPTALTVTGWYQLDLTWDNVGAIGDETVEVWFEDASGGFAKIEELPVSGTSQTRTYIYPTPIFGLGDTVTFALRYRRGTLYTAGYDNPVISGWSGTAVTDSTINVAIPAAPIADPTSPFEADCNVYYFGPKQYLKIKVAATSTIDHGFLDVYVSDTSHFSDAVLVDSVVISSIGEVLTSGWFGDWLVTGVPPGTDHEYVWVRQRGPDGAVSNEVAVPGDSPRDPTDLC